MHEFIDLLERRIHHQGVRGFGSDVGVLPKGQSHRRRRQCRRVVATIADMNRILKLRFEVVNRCVVSLVPPLRLLHNARMLDRAGAEKATAVEIVETPIHQNQRPARTLNNSFEVVSPVLEDELVYHRSAAVSKAFVRSDSKCV